MALSVQTNAASMSVLKHLNTNNANMNKALERLSSGFRINSSADDAAGYAIASKLEGEKARLTAASQNAIQATAMVKMADAAINEIQNMVVRIQTLATQAASGQNGTADLTALNSERVKLESQIDAIANGTAYNGTALLNGSGSTSGLTIQVGAGNTANDQVTVDFSKSFVSGTAGLNISNGGDLTTQTGAQAVVGTSTTALATLTTQRASLGASINQLGYVNANLANSIEQVSASISSIKDADMAMEMASFSKSQILVQAGTSMLSQANQSAKNILSLFR